MGGKVMKKENRLQWVLDNMGLGENVLHAEFVDRYIEVTGASFTPTMFGSFKCPLLGKDFLELYKRGLVQRTRVSLPGAGIGFPSWCYCYDKEKDQ